MTDEARSREAQDLLQGTRAGEGDELATAYRLLTRLFDRLLAQGTAYSELTLARSYLQAVLSGAEVDRIMAMTDEELLAETLANGEDPEQIASEMRVSLDRALSTPLPQGTRDSKGWKLVPVEPDDQMLTAGWQRANQGDCLSALDVITDSGCARIYTAMLAAAPPFPADGCLNASQVRHQQSVATSPCSDPTQVKTDG